MELDGGRAGTGRRFWFFVLAAPSALWDLSSPTRD